MQHLETYRKAKATLAYLKNWLKGLEAYDDRREIVGEFSTQHARLFSIKQPQPRGNFLHVQCSDGVVTERMLQKLLKHMPQVVQEVTDELEEEVSTLAKDAIQELNADVIKPPMPVHYRTVFMVALTGNTSYDVRHHVCRSNLPYANAEECGDVYMADNYSILHSTDNLAEAVRLAGVEGEPAPAII